MNNKPVDLEAARILIVDDELPTLAVLRQPLELAGGKVLVVRRFWGAGLDLRDVRIDGEPLKV